MNGKRTILFLSRLLAGLALLTALGGCNNNPHPRPLHSKRVDGNPWVVSYLRLPDDPRSLDPQVSYDVFGNIVITQIYESLLQYSPFKTDPYELEPCLAEEMPRRIKNPDGTETYEIHLKRGLFFQDDPCFPGGRGREMTAADFVYTFQRIADPAVECPVLSNLQEFIAGLGPAYLEARKAGKFDYAKPTGALTVVDDHTFRLNLLKPYPQIQYWLAMPFTAPVPREAVEYYNGKNGRDFFKFHPVGCGPYRVAEWSRSRLIRLVRHERYTATRFPTGGWPQTDEARFRPIAGAALPFVDELQLAVIRESIPAWLLFRQGYLDRSGISKDVFNSVITAGQTLSRDLSARGVKLYSDVEPATFYTQFNMEDHVVGKNILLRQALSTAYNEEQANTLFGSGLWVKAEQLLPPGVIGHDPHFTNPYRTQNLAQAEALLKQAGYPKAIAPKTSQPLTLTLEVIANSAEERQMAEFDQGQIQQLGLRCKIEENTFARFQDKQITGHFQMNTGSGWNADYPDPENFFALFYSKNIPPQGSNNTRFSNPEFDRLFERMSTMDNSPERLNIIRQLNAILVEQCPVILGFHRVVFTLYQPWVRRVSSNAMLLEGGGMKYVSLDAALRAKKIREWNRTSTWPLWTLAGVIALVIGYALARARKSNL